MRIAFHLPPATLARCFRPADIDRLRAAAHEVTFTDNSPDAVPDAHVIVTGWSTPPLTPAALDGCPSARFLVHSAGSVKHLLPADFWSRNIRLATANEALAVGVAETTLGLIIAGLKNVFPFSAATRAGGWRGAPGAPTGGFVCRELFDLPIGIVGASQCGRHVLRLLRNFEVPVFLTDPCLTPQDAQDLGATLVPLDDLLRRCDVVSLHAPALPSTRHMFSHRQFSLMRDGAIFINTARGMIVDEDALVAELRTGRIFAFLDVTDPEPPPADHPFRSLANCVLLPHVAGALTNGCFRQGRSTVDQVLEFAAGRTPTHGEVTRDRLPAMA